MTKFVSLSYGELIVLDIVEMGQGKIVRRLYEDVLCLSHDDSFNCDWRIFQHKNISKYEISLTYSDGEEQDIWSFAEVEVVMDGEADNITLYTIELREWHSGSASYLISDWRIL